MLDTPEGAEARGLLSWLIGSSPWDGSSGGPAGPPQFPRGRNYLESPNRLVGYAAIFRSEWACRKFDDQRVRAQR